MKRIVFPELKNIAQLLQRPAIETASLEASVRQILGEVKSGGDDAVRKFTAKFDKAQPQSIVLAPEQWRAQAERCPEALRTAMNVAAENIRHFHMAQQERSQLVETMPGVIHTDIDTLSLALYP